MTLDLFIASALFGLLPESLFFTLFISTCKGLKNRRLQVFVSVFILTCIVTWFVAFNIYYHIIIVACVYGIMFIFWKSHFIDIFLFSLALITLLICDVFCMAIALGLHNLGFSDYVSYLIALILNRALIFVILFMLRRPLRKLTKAYYNVWDRKDGSRIKSITVRNISVIILNVTIIAFLLFFSLYVSVNQESGSVLFQ